MSTTGYAASAMYQTIHDQPAQLRRIAREEADACARAGALLAGARRLFLVGTGTSLHAALVAEHLFRAAGCDAFAAPAFDFALYPPRLGPDDAVLVISHRGTKQYSLRALAVAGSSGARTLVVTGHDVPVEGAGLVLRTVRQERSPAHTASYLGALAVAAATASACGRTRGEEMSALSAGLDALPNVVEDIIAREQEIRRIAQATRDVPRFTFVGGGPNAATATEAALKIKETSYAQAEGFAVEQFLHGPFAATHAGDLLTLICAEGPSLTRLAEAATGAADVGLRTWVIGAGLDAPAEFTFPIASLPEPLSPAALAVPVQLFALFLAEARGTNPDAFHLNDPRYRQAATRWTL